MTSLGGGEGSQGVNPASSFLLYRDVLKIPFFILFHHDNQYYQAKINQQEGFSIIIYYIVIVIQFVQLIGPSFLLNCKDIWDDSVFTQFLQYVSIFWDSLDTDDGESREISSLVLGVIITLNGIITIIMVQKFKKIGIVPRAEGIYMMLTTNNIIPLMLPIMFAGIPISIINLFNGMKSISVVALLLAIIAFISGIYFEAVQASRLLVENNPSHEWSGYYKAFYTIFIVIQVFLGILASKLNRIGECVIIVIMFILYLSFGLLNISTFTTMKYQFSVWIAGLSFTGAFALLINLIVVFTKPLKSAVLIILFVVALVLSFVICYIMTKRRVLELISFLSRCEENPAECESMMDQRWTNAQKFIVDMRVGFQMFHPFYLSWKPFNYAYQKYHQNQRILFMWCRIVSLFPHEEELFRWLINQYSQVSSGFVRTSLILQMISLTNSRVVETTPKIRTQLDKAEKDMAHIVIVQRRIWENILQKSMDAFWNEIRMVYSLMGKLQVEINHLLDQYPNNTDIMEFYCQYLLDIKGDIGRYKKWTDKLRSCKNGTNTKIDYALRAAHSFLPELGKICNQCQLSTSNPTEEKTSNSDDDLDQASIQLKHSLQDLISHSRLGNVNIYFVGLIIADVAALTVFGLFVTYFQKAVAIDILNKQMFLRQMYEALLDGTYLSFCVNGYPLYGPGHELGPPLLRELAPTLFGKYEAIPGYPFNIEYINNIATRCLLVMDGLNDRLQKMDTNDEAVRTVYEEFFVEAPDGSSPSIQALLMKSLLNMITIIEDPGPPNYLLDEKYLDFDTKLEPLYQQILPILDKLALSVKKSKPIIIKNINNFLVLDIAVIIIFHSIPLILAAYANQMQCTSLSNAFTSLPNTAIRNVLAKLNNSKSKDGEKKESYEYASNAAMLSPNHSESKVLKILIVEFLISMIAIIAGSMYLYYTALMFFGTAMLGIERTNEAHRPLIFTSLAMSRLIRLSQYSTLSSFITSSYPVNPMLHRKYGNEDIKEVTTAFIYGYWGNLSAMNLYYKSKNPVYQFQDLVPYSDPDNMLEKELTLLEQFLVSDYPDANDAVIRHLTQLFRNETIDSYDHTVLSLLYYVSFYCSNLRNGVFLDDINSGIDNEFYGVEENANIVLYVVVIVQILALTCNFVFLIEKRKLVTKALNFMMFVDPQVIMNDQSIINLITRRRLNNVVIDSQFKNSEQIVSNLDEGVVLLNTSMEIIDANHSFLKLVELTRKEVIGKMVSDIIKPANEIGNSIENVTVKTHEAIRGNIAPSFIEKMIMRTINGKRKIIQIQMIGLNSVGLASEGDTLKLIAFTMEDLTAHYENEERIKKQQEKTTIMLNKVLPIHIITMLQNGQESISFSVQSASIGFISVSTDTNWESESMFEPFKFYGKVFALFDEVLSGFKLLNKVKTCFNTYVYAGGIFTNVNKPDKHAEEATRFAVKLLNSVHEFEEKVGKRIVLSIGLNTGGPLVAGVMSINKPSFQLIGPAVELAQQMLVHGIPNRIHSTRSVYELIYAYNFDVIERGDINIRNNRTLHTYVITP